MYDYAMKAFKEKIPVKSLIQKDEVIMAALTQKELDDAFDYMSYVGTCPAQVDAALELTK